MSVKYEKPLIIPLKSRTDETGMGAHCSSGSGASFQCKVGVGALSKCDAGTGF